MAEFISVETEVKEALAVFSEIENASHKIQRSILAGLGSKAASIIKKNYANSLRKKSGNLYKDMKKKVTTRGDAVVVSSNALSENKVRYGYVLAAGTTIETKNGNYLTFKIDGKWIRKKSVTIPSRDWVAKPVETFIDSSEYKAQIDNLIEREIKKLRKKGIIE